MALPNFEPSYAFGERLRLLRTAAGLTQRGLARRINLSQPRISQLETGESIRPLPLRTLRDIANVLGVTLEVLIGDDPVYEAMDLDELRDPLPPQMTSPRSFVDLVGRADDVAALVAMVQAGERLVTLVGPGGVGKTQLAIHVANALKADLPAGVCFVSLAPCREAGSVVRTVAHAAGLHEQDALPLRSRLLRDLPRDRLLFVLDNVEQAVAPVSSLTAELMAAYPDLTILVTSRRPLNLQQERQYAVRPLAVPDSKDAISVSTAIGSPAVRLFVERAQNVVPHFALTAQNATHIAAICRRLDGLPLAIELAAPWLRVFAPSQLLRQLDRHITILTGGASDLPSRHRSLHASVAWSFELLNANQQLLLRQLAVFEGGFTLEAAAKVASGALANRPQAEAPLPSESRLDTIAASVRALLDQNLLSWAKHGNGTPRFVMLETIRDFVLGHCIASDEMSELRQRHRQWMIALAEQGDAALFGFEEEAWLALLDDEWENAQAALHWAIESRNVGASLRLAAALTDYWYVRGLLSEGAHWLDAALALATESSTGVDLGRERVRALNAASQIAQPRGDLRGAGSRAEEALELARALGDRRGEARALALLANHALVQDDWFRAESLHRAALTQLREFGEDHRWIVAGLNNLSLIACEKGDYDEALSLASEALTIATQSGDRWGLAMAHQRLGDAALGLNQIDRAADHFVHSLIENRRQRLTWGIANGVAACASLATVASTPLRAVRLFAAAAALYELVGVSIPPKLRPDWTRMIDRARVMCGDKQFALAWEAGARLPVEKAIAEALAVAAQSAGNELIPRQAARAARRHQHRYANVRVRKRGTHPVRS